MGTLRISPLFLLAPLVIYWLVHRLVRAKLNSIRHLSGPDDAHWLWGHELIAYESPYEEAYTKWMDSYGPTYRIKGALFQPDIIVTGDHDAIACMYGKGVYSYVKSPIIRPLLERLMGRGLVWAEGSTHKRQRQQLSPFFTTQAIRDTFGTINACALRGVENLEAYINEHADNPKQGLDLDISEWTSSITLDIIGRFAFNYDFESGRSRAAQVIKHSWREQIKTGLHWAALPGQVIVRVLPFIAHLPIPVLEAQLTVKRKLREIAQSIIDGDVNEGKESDMLSTMARLSGKGEIDSTQDELLDHVCTMVVAGQETTSGSLGFTLHLLATNPKYQTHLREEIVKLGREPSYDDLMSGMPWLDAIMKESFRHRPIISHMERVATEDCVLKLGTPVQASDGTRITEMSIKGGQVFHIPALSVNHMKSVWGGDADDFKPERWFDSARLDSGNKNFGWNGMLSFSEGARQCIGYRLAILSFKTALATYIRKFEFHDTGAAVHGRFVGTLQPYVPGEEDNSTQLPLRVTLVDELGGN
ncbi:cytochrome P450 [Rhizoctonia solani]|nr:cytochrome P450 [Rhizoctonia solani]